MGLRFDPSNLLAQMNAQQKRTAYAARQLCQTQAKRMEAQAKRDAKWDDITGAARGGIRGRVDERGSRLRITLSGSVRYVVYLELAMHKRFAVLWPTVEKNRAAFLRALGSLWRR